MSGLVGNSRRHILSCRGSYSFKVIAIYERDFSAANLKTVKFSSFSVDKSYTLADPLLEIAATATQNIFHSYRNCLNLWQLEYFDEIMEKRF